MAKTAILAIKIISDATKAAKGMQQAETASERMGRRISTAAKVAKVGLVALGGAAFQAAKNAARDASAQALLAKAMRNVGQGSKAQVKQMEAFITATSRAAGVSDDELRPALGTLVRATGSATKSQAELKAALDVAAATGKPVESVAKAIAKAHSGQTTALARLVPGIDQATLKSKNMTKIMAELARITGGDAATAANTADGKVRRMKIAFDEASESLGVILIPALSFLASILGNVGIFVQNNTTAVQIAAVVLGTLAGAVVTINAAYKSYKAIAQAVKTVQLALNIVLAANPIGLIIVAVIALVAGFVLLYKHSSRFRAIVQAAGHGGQVAIHWIVDETGKLIGWFAKLGPAANKAKDIGVKAFKLYISPITLTVKAIEKLIGWIQKIHFPKPPKWLGKVAGAVGLGGGSAPHSPGGRVPVGGRGGPGGFGGFTTTVGGSQSGGGVTIIVQGALDPVAVAKQIKDILRGSDLRQGAIA